MYLRSLKVAGFKSFADRTRLEFRPGVAVVVGPNGSGKSNLVDAVQWVMGTQAPKSIRTSRMEDVIFAGTATRPALNRAEATVVFDNSDRALPLDLDEVSITRRLYRDGSSDYEINGAGCRLLDIQELLADSGVGRHQHVIVGQGQVDAVLGADPGQHRAIIEEAAGILKHRLRKERALRRLERTDDDVVRLNDILGELGRQMRPLKRQAEAADRHQRVAEEARRLRLFLAGEQLRDLDRSAADAAREQQDLLNSNGENARERQQLGERLRQLTGEAARLGETIDRDRGAAARLETTLERLRRIAQVAQERHRTRRARSEGASERRRDLESELAGLDSQVADARLAEERAVAAAAEEEGRFRAADDESRSLADREDLSPDGALALVLGELRALEAAAERDQREIEAVGRRQEVVSAQLEQERAEVTRLGADVRILDTEIGQSSAIYQATTRQRDGVQREWEAAEAARQEALVALAGGRARVEALEAAAAGLADPEGRRVAEQAPGAQGLAASLLDIPRGWAAAIDAALGPWAGAVAFADGAAMAAAVGDLKSAGAGGVGVIGLGIEAGTASPARSLATEMGLEMLVDLLGPRHHPGLAESLLADVVVVEGWQAGWKLVQRQPGIRAVTPEGDLITSSGIRLAHPDGATPAVVEAARSEVDRLEREMARAESRYRTSRRAFEDARASEREALEALETLEAKLAGATEALARAQRAVSDLEADAGRWDDRRRALTESAEARAGQLARLQSTAASLQGEEGRSLAAEMAEARHRIASVREEALASWQEASRQASAAAQKRDLLEARRQVIAAELTTLHSAPPSPAALERLASVGEIARMAIGVLTERVAVLRERQQEERQHAGVVGEELAAVRGSHARAEAEAERIRERLGLLAIELAEARVRRESLLEGLRRELDAGEEEALGQQPPSGEGEMEAVRFEERLRIAEADLRRMGPVNPLAAEEYRQLSERHEFMSSQLADLESSRAELRKVIKALDQEIETQFLAAFEEVAAAYQDHFGILFPGGRGVMRLTDPADPLAAGVELEAQPLGKRVGSLSLLSGGERSLAALAFLFAIFRARPSPFYILDEVEAALDDSNLRRFLRLIEDFRGSSQLIIVTHQQQTMEAADVLYGVTMEPGGSSQVLTKSLVVAEA